MHFDTIEAQIASLHDSTLLPKNIRPAKKTALKVNLYKSSIILIYRVDSTQNYYYIETRSNWKSVNCELMWALSAFVLRHSKQHHWNLSSTLQMSTTYLSFNEQMILMSDWSRLMHNNEQKEIHLGHLFYWNQFAYKYVCFSLWTGSGVDRQALPRISDGFVFFSWLSINKRNLFYRYSENRWIDR